MRAAALRRPLTDEKDDLVREKSSGGIWRLFKGGDGLAMLKEAAEQRQLNRLHPDRPHKKKRSAG